MADTKDDNPVVDADSHASGAGYEPEGSLGANVAETVFASLRDGLMMLDVEGRVLAVNPAMRTMLGLGGAELNGRRLDDLEGNTGLCMFVSRTGTGPACSYITGCSKYELEKCDAVGADGTRIGTVAQLRRLELATGDENRYSQLLTIITHDLKSPVATVLDYANLILDGSMGEQQAPVKESVSAISRSANKVLDIIDSYQALSRLESGRPGLDCQPVNLADLLQSAVRRVSSGHGYGRIVMEPALKPPLVECDHRLVERAISGLITSALGLGTPGEGIITVSARTAAQAGYVELSVDDGWLGVTEECLAGLLDRRMRLAGRSSPPGYGLGLAVVRLVAQAHRGFVRVARGQGDGFRISLALPVKQPPA